MAHGDCSGWGARALVAGSLWMLGACLDSTDGPGSGGSGSNSAICIQLESKLRGCSLLTEGEIDCGFDSDDERCQSQCALESSCDSLEELFCSFEDPSGPALLDVDQEVIACWSECMADSGFECDNGQMVPGDWVCDLEDDCGDGSDEADCEGQLFTCGDGEPISESWVCDGFEDCSDGSDEADCATAFFTCDDGAEVPMDWRCDGGEDCSDGSDESGCPQEAQLLCMGEPVGN